MKKPECTEHWNGLVYIVNYSKDEKAKEYAKMLLRQLNTASGRRIHPDIEEFLTEHLPNID